MATSGEAGEVKKKVATIGVVAVTAIIMGNMIGAGIFTICLLYTSDAADE